MIQKVIICSTLIFYSVINTYEISPKIIIIGAGPSGIASATRFLKSNITDILLLEAEDRIGGRVHSVFFGDAMIDLGAQWCHGEEDNIVFEIVKEMNLLGSTKESLKYCHSTYDISPEFNEELVNMFEELHAGLHQDKETMIEQNDLTLGDFFTIKHQKLMENSFKMNSTKLKIVREALDMFLHLAIGWEGALSWDEPAAVSDYRQCKGNFVLNWKGRGYGTILDVLMEKYPDPNKTLPIDDKILFKKEVTKLIWKNNSENPNGVTVHCSDGSVYNAERVIFTPSLSVLKHCYDDLFSPHLPASKINVIKELGMGAIVKIFLHFPERWWFFDFMGFNFIWSKEDKEELEAEALVGKVNRTWLLGMNAMYPLEKENPNVLSIWITGIMVPEVELLDDNEIISGVMFAIKKFLGRDFNITKPDKMIHSAWYNNPHFKGVYSFQTVPSRKHEFSGEMLLSMPLENEKGKLTLLFAGEATHPRYFSTVHGAIETGYREANRIINLSNIS